MCDGSSFKLFDYQCIVHLFRTILWECIKILFSRQLLIPIVGLWTIIGIVCYVLYLLNIWSIMYLKDVILYSCTAIPLSFTAIKYSKQEEFKYIVFQQIQYTTIVAVYLNTYTLTYWYELILQSLLCFLSILIVMLETQHKTDDNSKQLLGCFSASNLTITLFLIGYVLYSTFTHPIVITLERMVQGIMLPLILTIAINSVLNVFLEVSVLY